MPQFLLTWLLAAASLLITAKLVPGLSIEGFVPSIVGSAMMGFINATVKPVLQLLTLPLTILTLGLFLLIVNAVSFGLVGYLTPGFEVNGFFPAVIGSIVLSLVSWALNGLFGTEENA